MYFLKDTKLESNKVKSIIGTENATAEIVFESGNKYTYDGENLYLNKILICSNLTKFVVTESLEENYGKTVLTVEMKIGQVVVFSNIFEKTTEYVMTTKSNITYSTPDSSFIDNTKSYTVTFDPNGGTMDQLSKKLRKGEIYGNLPMPNSTADFLGWFTEKTGGTRVYEQTVMNREEDHILYAQYRVNTVTVYFNTSMNGGDPITLQFKQVIRGLTYGELPTATKPGHIFTGWYRSAQSFSGETRVESSTIVTSTSSHTLYARFQAVTITVTFNPQGRLYTSELNATSTILTTATVTPTSQEVTGGQAYGNLPVPNCNDTFIVEGNSYDTYHFLGWYTEEIGGTKITAETIVTSTTNHTLYARWAKKVTFDGTYLILPQGISGVLKAQYASCNYHPSSPIFTPVNGPCIFTIRSTSSANPTGCNYCSNSYYPGVAYSMQYNSTGFVQAGPSGYTWY